MDFVSKMNATNLYFKNFQEQLNKNGVVISLTSSKTVVKQYLMAEFARQLYGENKYYEIVLKGDAMIRAVLNNKSKK
jgi:carboxyl-terminal processing protease